MARPKALVFRGESTEGDDDLAEPIAHLLRSSSYNFEVDFCGPNEDIDLDEEGLEDVVLFAMPGGPDLEEAYEELKESEHDLKQWIRNGGRYLGICLGAYLCGHAPGFGLFPKGADTDSECTQRGAQVTTDEDAIIQVDWTFSHGPRAGQTHKNQWIFYQEGPCIKNFPETDDSFVVARYSKTGHIAATLNEFGRGWVGCIGPHPEADQTWFDEYDLPTPQGLRYDIGYDLITSLMEGQACRPSNSVIVDGMGINGVQGRGKATKKNPRKDEDEDDEDDDDEDDDDDSEDDDDDSEDDEDDDVDEEDDEEKRGPKALIGKLRGLMQK